MIRLDSGISFANSLKHNRSLVKLDLSYNGLGSDGGMALGASLIDNQSLQVLDMPCSAAQRHVHLPSCNIYRI